MHLRTLVRAAAVPLLLAACQPSNQATTETAADSAALRDLSAAYAAAWNARDAAAIAGLMSSDYHEVSPAGAHHSSAADAQAAMAAELSQMPEGSSITLTTAFTRFIDANHAYSGGTYTVTGMPAGMPTQGSWLVVNVKDESGWKMASGLGAADITPMLPAIPAGTP
jgi:uncharacterized protein (TIGR02246 family)